MSLIDLFLLRRSRRSSTALSKCAPTYRPRLEVLEERQCLSVAAPTGLHAVAISPTEVKLTWHDVVGEQGFRIFRQDGTQPILEVKPTSLHQRVPLLVGSEEEMDVLMKMLA